MSDNLRDRITKAIADAQFAFDNGDPYNGPEDADVLADAVIRELGLTRVTRSERVPKHRYVTEWATDETD